VKEWADKLEASAKTRLDGALEGAKQSLRSGNPEDIAKALEERGFGFHGPHRRGKIHAAA